MRALLLTRALHLCTTYSRCVHCTHSPYAVICYPIFDPYSKHGSYALPCEWLCVGKCNAIWEAIVVVPSRSPRRIPSPSLHLPEQIGSRLPTALCPRFGHAHVGLLRCVARARKGSLCLSRRTRFLRFHASHFRSDMCNRNGRFSASFSPPPRGQEEECSGHN